MIKWGIIGPGTIANAFAQEVQNTEKGKLIAVYGRNEDKARKFAKEYNDKERAKHSFWAAKLLIIF